MGFYIFQPYEIDDVNILMKYRKLPLKNIVDKIKIEQKILQENIKIFKKKNIKIFQDISPPSSPQLKSLKLQKDDLTLEEKINIELNRWFPKKNPRNRFSWIEADDIGLAKQIIKEMIFDRLDSDKRLELLQNIYSKNTRISKDIRDSFIRCLDSNNKEPCQLIRNNDTGDEDSPTKRGNIKGFRYYKDRFTKKPVVVYFNKKSVKKGSSKPFKPAMAGEKLIYQKSVGSMPVIKTEELPLIYSFIKQHKTKKILEFLIINGHYKTKTAIGKKKTDKRN